MPNLKDCNFLKLEKLRNSNILITGATGLVGFNIVKELSEISNEYNIRILVLVRNEEKARTVFKNLNGEIVLIKGDVRNPIVTDERIDYIIHAASVTASVSFVNEPVETIMTSVMGTVNLLNLAKEKQTKSVVYLSSMEVYGSIYEEKLLNETDLGYLDPLNIRSSYPQSKRMCESICISYASEYDVDVKIARLAQTFGPGMQKEDKRAVVQFMQSAINNKDIEIKASGESARMYLYTFDAVTALLTLLLNGKKGEAYNVANKSTYCSIKELAEKIVETLNSESNVLVNTGTEEERKIYPPDSFLRLDISKLENLGWKAKVDILKMIENTKTGLY